MTGQLGVPQTRVCLVTPRFAPYIGGVEIHVEQLARELAAVGNRVEVFTQASRHVLAQHPAVEHRDGFTVHRYALPYTVSTDLVSPGLIRALRAVDADVVHAHNYHALPAALAAALAGTRRFVFTPHYHGTGSTSLATAAHRIYRPVFGHRAITRADAVIAVSPSERLLLARDFGTDLGQRTFVVPNGVRAVSGRITAGGGRQDDVILFVGRLDAYKRVDVLVRAVALLPDRFRLVVVGGGTELLKLTMLANKLRVSHRVAFTGQIAQAALDVWMKRAAVFATASRLEAFGMTFADALASGLPAVASSIPAHQDVAAMAFGEHLPTDVTLVPDRYGDQETARAYAAAVLSVCDEVTPSKRSHTLPSWPEVAAQVCHIYNGHHSDISHGQAASSWQR